MTKQPSPDPLFTLRGDMEAVHSLLFHLNEDSEYIYASTQAGIVHKWNLQSCREETQVKVSTEACLAVRAVQNYFITQTKGGEIKLWEEIEEKWKLKNDANFDYWGFCKLDIYSNNFLVCAESASKLRIVDLSGKTVNTLCPHTADNCGEVMAVQCATLTGTDYVFVLYESGVLALFEAGGGAAVSDCKMTTDCPMALDFDGSSKGVIGSSGDVIVGFELTSDLRTVKWKEVSITNAGVSCVVIRPDKKLFAAGCWDTRVRLFSMKSLKLLAVLQNHKETVQVVCYSPTTVRAWDTRWLLAAASKDGRITLWNLY